MSNFYKTRSWEKKRSRILRHDEYLCQECKRYGKRKAAQTVHHINPLLDHPVLALVSANLVSLCNSCHDKMHDRTTGILTPLGETWRERRKGEIERWMSGKTLTQQDTEESGRS